jgi:hypothetical protein
MPVRSAQPHGLVDCVEEPAQRREPAACLGLLLLGSQEVGAYPVTSLRRSSARPPTARPSPRQAAVHGACNQPKALTAAAEPLDRGLDLPRIGREEPGPESEEPAGTARRDEGSRVPGDRRLSFAPAPDHNHLPLRSDEQVRAFGRLAQAVELGRELPLPVRPGPPLADMQDGKRRREDDEPGQHREAEGGARIEPEQVG